MKLMAGIVLAIAVSVHSVVAFDFAMSIAPMWHSTVFAPYFVAGAIFSGIAALVLVMAALRRFLHLEKYYGRCTSTILRNCSYSCAWSGCTSRSRST